MLTASEFLAAFFRDMPLSPCAAGVQLHALERTVLHVVPRAAAFAQAVAEGRLHGAALRDECGAVVNAVADLDAEARPFERGLFLARITVGLPARAFDPLAQGQSATAALIHVAKRVVAAVYNALCEIAAEWGSLGCAEDDDPVLDADVLTRPSVAAAMRESLAALSFLQPGPLLHEMQAELMQLATAAVQAVELTGRPAPDELDDLGRTHGDDAPSVPMREAAKRTKKRKEEDDPEPMPPENPHPVNVMNVDEIVRKFAELLKETAPRDGPPSSAAPEGFTFSPDTRSLVWGAERFTFTDKQARVVQQLWRARLDGTLDVLQAYLLEEADSDMVESKRPRVRDLFKNHHAWGLLIVGGEKKGTLRLQAPPRK